MVPHWSENLHALFGPGARWGTRAGFFLHALILSGFALTITGLRWVLAPGEFHLYLGIVFWAIALFMHGCALVIYPQHPD